MARLNGGKYLLDLSHIELQPSTEKDVPLTIEQINIILTKSLRLKINLDGSIVEHDIIPTLLFTDGSFDITLTDDYQYECRIQFKKSESKLILSYSEL